MKRNINGLPGYETIATRFYRGQEVALKANRTFEVRFDTHTAVCLTRSQVDEAITEYETELFVMMPTYE